MDEEFDPQAFISGDDETDPYKQALIQKITSGATDYTYGPGSPGATPADMRQKTGSHDNPLQTGDIALPQKDYELFTPEERKTLGIADTSWIREGQPTPRGSVERYFGPEAGAFDPQRFIKRQDLKAPDATVPDINAFMEPAPTDTPEADTTKEPSTAEVVGGAISKAASKFGASLRDIPKMEFTKPEFQPPAIPQVPQPQTQVIPGQGMIGAAIPQALPTPPLGAIPQTAPVVQGTMEGLQQTAAGMVPHTMEQFHGLAQMMGAPTDPFGFFQSALQQGLVTAKTAQDAIKAGPLSKEAGVAYGTIIPQALMMLGGLRGAGAVPSAGAVAKSFIGTNQLPHMQEVGSVGYTGGGREVPVPEAFQPRGTTAENVPTNRPEPQLPEPQQFSIDMPADKFATEHAPVSSALHEMKVLSKSGAKRSGKYDRNPDLWDGAPQLAHPTHNKIYGADGVMPDVAAQALHEAGLIADPSADTMWRAVEQESKSSRSTLRSQSSDAKAIGQASKVQAGQTKAFNAAERAAWKGGEPAIPVKDLQVGDTVTVGGEKFKVTDIDPDTFDVTLEDGSKYGVQSVSDNTVIYGKHEGTGAKQPPTPVVSNPLDAKISNQQRVNAALQSHPIQQMKAGGIGQKPPQGPPPQKAQPVPPTAPPPPKDLNPVPGSGKFRRSYRVDKEMGDQMEGIGAARESGYLRAELQSRNMLHELSPQQEADMGRLLVSDRLKTVNPQHPQVIFDSVARGIESDPAIAKALDYYKREVKPEIEALRKRAGLSAKAAAGKQAGFISLIVKNAEPLTPGQGGILRTGQLSRTTRFAKLAEGQAKEYSTNLREILSESYSEALKKARVREFYDSTIAKGITEDGTYEELPAPLQHDLTAATQPELNQMPIQSNPNFGLASKLGDLLRAAGKGYQRFVTGMALTANPAELMNHMRRQLNIVASKPPVGMGVMARMEWLLPYFGPKLGAFKRVVMDDMSTLQNKSILKDIFDAGGGSSRSFGERYESHIPGLRQVQKGTQKLLFGVPRGRGVGGWDLRMRVQLEKMRRSVEGNVDPQRIREFANQIGQYGSQNSWFIRGLRKINPYAATSVPMRVTELKTLFGQAGFKEPLSRKALHTAETILRGTGGTLIAAASANYLLSGKWPWQNDAGHEFDINTGVKDKKGNWIYLKERAFAPEMSRPVSTLSAPDILRERKAKHPQYLAAAMTGPANQALSLVSGPGQNLAFTAATGKVPYLLKRPGEGPEFMDVATLKKGEAAQGVSRGGRQLLKALSSINPLGERLASQHEEDAPGALGYIEEPIPGVRPFGDIFSTSYESRSGGGYSRSTSQGRGGGGRSSGRGQGGR